MKPPTASQIAPGSRIRARDEEWLVRKVDRSSTGNLRFAVVGLSPLVRNREALFLEDLEDDLEIVDPARTRPAADPSPYYRDTRLHLEFLLRQTVPSDARLRIGHRGAMDVVPYQLDPAHLALQQPRQRILIADAVGLGKTIEAGVLLSELIRRGRGRRILVLTVKSMLTQFQKELWARFSIPLVRLDSAALQRIRTRIPANHNPFHYFDKTIVSIDTVKQNGEYRNFLESGWWDVIVIDEAHNVARRGGGQGAMRHKVAQLLASRSDSLILLSATPHDGSRESFASIMNMLNPTAIKNPADYGPEDIEGLFIRRFKKDIRDQVKTAFPQRTTEIHRRAASDAEEIAYESLANLTFAAIDQHRGGHLLFRTLLEKALFSSPAACLETIESRLVTIRRDANPDRFAIDAATLCDLRESLQKIRPSSFSKYQLLVSVLRDGGKTGTPWTAKNAGDRLVIFTERIATLDWLRDHLPGDLGLKSNEVAILHGGLSDIEQQEIVEAFGNDSSPVRLLIASDVASEGINLHYLSHRLIHFDIPWSLLTFQQRNGRVDRYGQEQQPEIHYLLTESAHERIRGDLRILEVLIRKDDQVQKNIGDPSEFTGLHTAEEEEAEIGKAIEAGVDASAFEETFGGPRKLSTDDPFLAALFGELPKSTTSEASIASLTSETPSLYPDDYAWAKAALEFTRESAGRLIQAECLDDRREIHLHLPPDLRRRLQRLPREIRPADDQWVLTCDRTAVMKEIAACRKEEGRWPTIQLLWELHPFMQWLEDKILAAFGRSEAPVVHCPALTSGETIVLAYGLIPNPKPSELRDAAIAYRKGTVTTQWKPAKTQRPERDLVYIGIRSCLPAIERHTEHDLRTARYEPHEDERHQRVLAAAGKILNVSYDRWEKVTLLDSPNRHYIALRRSGKTESHPSVILGAGEQRLLDLLLQVEQSEKNALILIDEIDLLMHGDALNRLIDHLILACKNKNRQLVFTSYRESLLKLDGRINVRHIHFYADRFFCFPNTDPASLRRLTGEQERRLEVFVEDIMAETIVRHLASTLGISQSVKVTQFGAASNCFTVLAGLLLKGETCENSLFVLDGDVFLLEGERESERKRACSGDDPATVAKRGKMSDLIVDFRLPANSKPEPYLHQLICSLPEVGLDPGHLEIQTLAGEIVNPEDRHHFIDKIVERLGGSRDATLARVIQLCSRHESWAAYTAPVWDWLNAKKVENGL